MKYAPGDNVRLVNGRIARIVRVLEGLYDVRLHEGDTDRIDVLPEDIVCRVRRVTVWEDEPPDV